MKPIAFSFGLFLTALIVFWNIEGNALAQGFAAPSGCRTSTVKNALLFTQTRTGSPGDTNVVVGAFTVKDDDVKDTGVVANASCTPPGPADGHPTHVTVITVTVAGGDLAGTDVRAVRLLLDGNKDAFFEAGQDQQLGADLPGYCLSSQCIFSFGRTAPLFNVNEAGTEDITKSFLITVDLGPNAHAGANLMVTVMAEANNIIPLGSDWISSDFNDSFRTQSSNIRLKVLPLSENINNGSGSSETGTTALKVSGLLSRYGAEKIVPGTNEAIAAIIYVCEGGSTPIQNVTILPAVVSATPTIGGYPQSLACVTSSNPDTFATRLLRVRVGVSGNAGAVGTMRLWDDANDNGVLFESGEFVLSAGPVGGVAVFGSLNNPLLSGTRPNADPAPGMWSAQAKPLVQCDSTADNPQPQGASKGCPHVLVITFDVALVWVTSPSKAARATRPQPRPTCYHLRRCLQRFISRVHPST